MTRRSAPTVALDYTSGPGHAPGVGRYVRELVRALVRLPAQNAFPLELLEVGRAPRPMEGAPLGLAGVPDGGVPFERRVTRLPRRIVAQGARAPRLARALIGPSRHAGLIHRVTADWPPIGALPSSLAVAEFPALGSAGAAALADACRRAAGVIVFSADGAERVEAHFGVDPRKIFRSPVGSEHWERDGRADGSAGPNGIAPRASRDVLVLGAIRRARFPLQALEAFGVLLRRGVEARLLMVGRPGDAKAEFTTELSAFRAQHGEHTVRWVEAPDEAKMPGCVAGSTVLLHLAEDEASPVTPLEAARMGLPLVASALPAFREVFGEKGLWVEARDPATVADALEVALIAGSDKQERQARTALAAPFTWEAAARAHGDAWKRMLSGP